MDLKANKPIKDVWQNLHKYNRYVAEPKLDGCRLFVQDGKLIRENGLVKNEQYPEVLEVVSKLPEGIVLDGELCNPINAFSADFNKLQHRINLKNKLRIKQLSKSEPASFVAFDILKYENQDLKSMPYHERFSLLGKVLEENLVIEDLNRLCRVNQYKPNDLFPLVTKYNMEGIVLKNPDATYRSNWIKMKAEYEIDCKVVGFTSETRLISALELEDQSGNYLGKVNYQQEQSETIAQKLKGMIAVVTYNRKTKDGKLVFPVLKELRKC